MAMNRRRFLKLALSSLPFAALPFPWLPPAPAAASSGFDPDRLFAGEGLDFEFTFWWFDCVGTAYLKFQRRKDGLGYVAQAGAETQGIIGFFLRFRKDRYRSFMTFDPRPGRLVSHRFEQEVIVGPEISRVVRIIDHKSQKVRTLRPRDDGSVKVEIEDLPAPDAVDYLAAFYNARGGVYGEPSQGLTRDIATVPNEEGKPMTITILDPEATARQRAKDKVDYPYFVQVKLDPRILGSRNGLVYFWMDEDMIPAKWVVPDVSILGDVRIKLTGHNRLPKETDIGPMVPVKFKADKW